MQELILTIGLPASGKSTWANHEIQCRPDFVNVNRDDIRLMLQGRARYNKFSKWREALVSEIQTATAKQALLAGKSVIISDTNLNPKFRSEWKIFANNFSVNYSKVEYKEQLFTDTHVGVCLERDKLREFPVGQNVIVGMFEKYQDIYWPKPEYDVDLKNAYIVDVDGTLAHMHNRRAYQWDKVGDDLPKQDVIDIVNALYAQHNEIIICSGRDGICKEDTVKWLNKHKVSFDYFYIRPEGDSRKDTLIKEEIYNNYIKGKFNVMGVFDDRDQVVHMWRQLGLTVLQVNYGDF